MPTIEGRKDKGNYGSFRHIPSAEPEPFDKNLRQNYTDNEEDEPIMIEDLLTS